MLSARDPARFTDFSRLPLDIHCLCTRSLYTRHMWIYSPSVRNGHRVLSFEIDRVDGRLASLNKGNSVKIRFRPSFHAAVTRSFSDYCDWWRLGCRFRESFKKYYSTNVNNEIYSTIVCVTFTKGDNKIFLRSVFNIRNYPSEWRNLWERPNLQLLNSRCTAF